MATAADLAPSGTYSRDYPETRTLAGALRLFFRFPTPRLFLSVVLVAALLRPLAGPVTLGDLLIVAAVALIWPLQEWFLHKNLLHFRPRTLAGRTIDPFAARVHRAHHRDPWLLEWVFLPIRLMLLLTPIHLALWWLLTPTLGLALTGWAALTAATLIYEWVHYLTHTVYRPRSAWYRQVWLNHRLHHFKNERYWHSFTLPLVDRLLGTGPQPGAVETSSTCRTLGVDAEDAQRGSAR